MWAVLVVMRGVLVEDGGEVSFAGDEHPVEAFGSGGADPAFGVGVGARRGWRRCDDVDAGAVNTVSKMAVTFASRSRGRNRRSSARWSRSMSGLRACWAARARVGWAVTPAMCTSRVARATKDST